MSKDDSNIRPLDRKLVNTGMEINDFLHDRPDYLHAIMCQLGLPRSRQESRTFKRSVGSASMLLQAGHRADAKGGWTELPLPYGSKPRLALIHISSEAVRTQSPHIDVSDGIVPFLKNAGISINGQGFKLFKDQMTYLSACEMNLAWTHGDRLDQMKCAPVQSFSAWADPFTAQSAFWPDELTLGHEFFETLCAHAVPLDPRAIYALKGSALALDIYSWMAYRLCKIRKDSGQKLYWKNLRDQFGQEYACPKNFKKAFSSALRQVMTVYPDAKVRTEQGGIRFYPSPPPIRKKRVVVKLPNGS